LNSTELFIISHLKFNIFGTLKNDFSPLKNALKKAKSLIKNLNYDEAFKVSIEDLPTFIETFFWLERSDPSAPEYIYFADVSGQFTFYLCKDGYIHFIEFENEIINAAILSSLDMYFVDKCNVKFLNY
jgi:hypothetical protein